MCEERFSRKHMAKIFNWKIFVSLVGLVSFFSFFYQTLLLLNHSAKHIPISSSLFRNKSLLGKRHDDNNFVACKLPELDPFHPSVIHFTKDFGKLRCNGASYSSFENNVLRVEGTGVVSVQYRTIQRPLGDDFGVVLSDPVRVRNEEKRNQTGYFSGSASVETDFIRVDVVTSSGDIKTDVHMHVFPKKEVLRRQSKPGRIPLNVALIMFDSTSAVNFQRKMPHSLDYLVKNMTSILFQGETIVGDGTTAQLTALLTGKTEKEQSEARKRIDSSRPVDNWRWIFKEFKKSGYATMFSEDSPHLASFNYRLKGFHDPPTDHYARPFWLEAFQLMMKSKFCLNSRPAHNESLNYLMSFFRRYQDTPKFAFSSHADISHDSVNTVGFADDDLKATLETMQKESLLKNTLLIIFSDHGPRFSGFRSTIQGKLEERFPFMSFTLPEWFQDEYPDLQSNLLHNSRVLTSPFDVYATLRHILSYPHYPRGILVGQSLFSRIDPRNRTCASAGVDDHWCPCLDLEEVGTNESVVMELADFVVLHINNLTSQNEELVKMCRRLKLKEVNRAFREMPSEAMQRFQGTTRDARDTCDGCGVVLGKKSRNTLVKDTLYQLHFVTSPNEGFYEATVRIQKGVPSLAGDISRIDAYKDQPYCIMEDFPLLRKYCYCFSRKLNISSQL